MSLKFKLDTLDGVESHVASLYAPAEDGKAFYLQVEGAVSSEKLAEFRDNNIALTNQLKTFAGVDPKKYAQLVELEANGKLNGKSKDEIDAIIQERVGAMRTEYETTIDGLNKTVGTQGAQLNVLLVDNVVRQASSQAGVTGPAVDDILLRAKAVFKLEGGTPVPHDEKGNVIYSNDGTTPLSVSGWVNGLKKSAPHLFPGSQGSGAPGGVRPTGGVNSGSMNAAQKISAGLRDRQSR